MAAVQTAEHSAATAAKGRERSGDPRVLMVVEKLYGLGGAQKQALRLSHALRGLGVEATIVTGRWRFCEPARAEVEGVPVTAVFTAFKMFHVKGIRKLGIYVYLLSLLLHLYRRRKHFDILHVHSATSSAFLVALAGRWLGKPTVMKVMASGPWSDFTRMKKSGEVPGSRSMSSFFRRVDRVICLNPEAKAECLAEGFATEKCISIPNGFPVREVRARVDYKQREVMRVVFSGRLDPQKNPLLLLEAMERVATKPGGERIEVLLLGDGPERSAVEERVRDLRLEKRVKLLGRVEDIETHLQDADIFVLPSNSEGISNALLEAMAHGVPSIATDIPGNAELIRDHETGLLVKPGDATGLGQAILELAEDSGLRERLGRAGRAFVEEWFEMETIARRYLEVYRELAEGMTTAV